MSSKKYPLELRERAVRMVAEVRDQYESEWAAIGAVAELLGVGTAETVRKWVRQEQVDVGARAGVTSEESAELKRLRRENAELKRANAILKSASASSRPNWTGRSAARQVYPRASGPPGRWWPAMGCRVDLRRAHRARRQDRPINVLRGPAQQVEENRQCDGRARPSSGASALLQRPYSHPQAPARATVGCCSAHLESVPGGRQALSGVRHPAAFELAEIEPHALD